MILNKGIKKFQELLVFLLNFFRQENVSFWFIFDITQAFVPKIFVNKKSIINYFNCINHYFNPCCPNPGQSEKINLNIYFHTSS